MSYYGAPDSNGLRSTASARALLRADPVGAHEIPNLGMPVPAPPTVDHHGGGSFVSRGASSRGPSQGPGNNDPGAPIDEYVAPQPIVGDGCEPRERYNKYYNNGGDHGTRAGDRRPSFVFLRANGGDRSASGGGGLSRGPSNVHAGGSFTQAPARHPTSSVPMVEADEATDGRDDAQRRHSARGAPDFHHPPQQQPAQYHGQYGGYPSSGARDLPSPPHGGGPGSYTRYPTSAAPFAPESEHSPSPDRTPYPPPQQHRGASVPQLPAIGSRRGSEVGSARGASVTSAGGTAYEAQRRASLKLGAPGSAPLPPVPTSGAGSRSPSVHGPGSRSPSVHGPGSGRGDVVGNAQRRKYEEELRRHQKKTVDELRGEAPPPGEFDGAPWAAQKVKDHKSWLAGGNPYARMISGGGAQQATRS